MDDLYFFVKQLKNYRKVLSKNEIKTIRGQALSGDLVGARTGLARLLNR